MIYMTKKEYYKKHKDYRSTIQGKPFLLTMIDGVTCLVQISFI